MNPDLDRLQPYPFERLARLLAGVRPPADRPPIALSIGEPRHPTPAVVSEALKGHLDGLGRYPTTRGTTPLREAIAAWIGRRFGAPLDPATQVLPVNGTREALFAVAQALVDRSRDPLVLMPNPFYQIYEGAALLAGAEPGFIPCTEATGLLPDFERVTDDQWRRCQVLYLCSPGNPTGAVIGRERLRDLIAKAQAHDFVIVADECYSEIYLDEAEPPTGLLEVAREMGLDDYRRCLAMNSLSKRSNAPGLRSGYVAGDARLIERFFLYRTYQGCALPLQHQAASIAAWNDEAHVRANRALYRAKFDAVLAILSPVLEVQRPQGGFYLWPRIGGDDRDFARGLYAERSVKVLPGRYLSREQAAGNPGAGRIRMALVAEAGACTEAAHRIREFIETHQEQT